MIVRIAAAVCLLSVFCSTACQAEEYPVGDRHTMWSDVATYGIGSYRHMSEIYYSRPVLASGKPSILPRGKQIRDITYWYGGAKRDLDDYFERARTTGFLVLKDGKIVCERYLLGADEHSLFTSFSMAKSVVSTLVGFAIGDGLIKSVDDPISKYVPELTGSGYDGVPIKAVLQMSSGIDFIDDYDSDTSQSSLMWDKTVGFNRAPLTDFVRKAARARPPFQQFNYTGLDTQALAWLIAKTTGKTLSEYLSAKMWQPLGMESDANWITDGKGPDANEVAYCCLNATLRDYARFGQFILDNGTWNHRQLLPNGWVHEATYPDRPQVDFGHLHAGWSAGYQYQWWVLPRGEAMIGGFEAQGVHGQFIYVKPEEHLVIVTTSAWLDNWNDMLEDEFYYIVDAFRAKLR